jgi:hypothetical protein
MKREKKIARRFCSYMNSIRATEKLELNSFAPPPPPLPEKQSRLGQYDAVVLFYFSK